MYQYYQIENLPPLPEELVSDVYWSIDNYKNVFYDPNHSWYKVFLANDKLQKFTKSILNFQHTALVQVIQKGLPIHIDFKRSYAFNYIIETGGESATTNFYKNEDFYFDQNNKLIPKFEIFDIVEKVCIPERTWHKINVTVPHNVTGIETQRIAITIGQQ